MDTRAFHRMAEGARTRFLLMGYRIPKQGILAGPEELADVPRWPEAPDLWIGEDNRHFPMNYGFLLREGICGLLARAEKGRQMVPTPEKAARLDAITDYLRAYADYIRAHATLAEVCAREWSEDAERYKRIARNCRAIACEEPKSFEEGVQLFYFTWRVRSVNSTSCIGRLDAQLGELYEKSRSKGMSREEAHGILCELIRKLNRLGSGDTLMNVMLGGVDESGRDISGDLGVLLMQCCAELGLSEPHFNVRIHSKTPDFFRQAAAKLIARGQGQGTLYMDADIIPSLVEKGVPLPIARCYANDGCTEVTLEGHADIQFWQVESMKSLELALFNGDENPTAPYTPVPKWNRNSPATRFHSELKLGIRSGKMIECRTFEEVMVCFYRQWDAQLERYCQRIADKIESDAHTDAFQSSLLVQALLPQVLDTGEEPLRGGYTCRNYQLLSGSLPTVADSLFAIKVAVFEQKLCNIDTLLKALCEDFAGYELLRNQLRRIDKFGNDAEGVDSLAAELSAHFCAYVEQYPFPCGVKVWPGMYNIDFLMFATSLGATPDGRRAGDAICCHYSPTPSCAYRGVTAALVSASKGNLRRGVAASPVYLTLPRLMDTDYTIIFRALMEGCGKLHLPIINFSVADVEELRDAQRNPDKHRDLVVRVWGYNAYFVDLDDGLQQHIIDRTVTNAGE